MRAETARPAPDLVERRFVAAGPDRLWVADITDVLTWAGFVYPAVVLDAWSRRVIGRATESHLRAGISRPRFAGDATPQTFLTPAREASR